MSDYNGYCLFKKIEEIINENKEELTNKELTSKICIELLNIDSKNLYIIKQQNYTP